MGVPQGSILSVTLFLVKINSIAQCLKPDVDSDLFTHTISPYFVLVIDRNMINTSYAKKPGKSP